MPIYTTEQIEAMISEKKERYQKMKLAGDLDSKEVQDFFSQELKPLYDLLKTVKA